jgi:hypothetical protein
MSQSYNNPWEFTNFDKTQISDDLIGRRVNGFEVILIIIGIATLIGVGVWGFLVQEKSNRDIQRNSDISQVISALNFFYKNSSAVEGDRVYPPAPCSASLNEVDYEQNLRWSLTGQNKELDDFSYMQSRTFPTDRSGVYSETLSQRQVPFRCPDRLSPPANNPDIIYEDFKSCNFKQATSLVQCYLYTSSATGDEFKIAYRSEVTGCFVVFSKFRSNNLIQSKQCS